ncbi:MAG: type III secretion system gatekeeper subunit SctW [Desulfovibrionaceae bacterium]|nr:type III secretion system gatekeeper subunit SctW [Desulfovibrionaceae bacterium]
MLNEISGQRMTNMSSDVSGAADQNPGTGTLIGKAVREVINPQSILQDALEELSYMFNKSDSCALRNRKERDQIDRNLKDRLKAFRQVNQSQGLDDKVLQELVEVIEAEPDREIILEKILEKYEEPSEAWAALAELADRLQSKGAAPEVLKEVNEALKLMDMRYGAAIRAGVAGTLTAAQNFVSLGAPLELGSTYRKAVLEFTSTLDLYNYIQNKHGGDFNKAVDFLYAALASDLNCEKPSASPISLQSANTSFGKLRSLQSAHALCDTQIKNWESKEHTGSTLKGIDMLGKLLDLGQNNFAGISDVQKIASDAKANSIEQRIWFLQETLQNVRKFSTLVFDNDQGRSNVIQAVQEAIDQSVDEEDAMLANQ